MEPVREREREIIGAEVSRMGEARMPKAAGTQIILSWAPDAAYGETVVNIFPFGFQYFFYILLFFIFKWKHLFYAIRYWTYVTYCFILFYRGL